MTVDQFYNAIRLAIVIFIFGTLALYFYAQIQRLRRRR